MYLKSNNKEECCGCRACEDICPINAIQCQTDDEGFWYPIIDLEKCIQCKKCESICTYNIFEPYKVYNVYAGWDNRSEARDKSSSGGIFGLIAEYVLNDNGLVVGAAFDDKFMVQHILVDNIKDLSKIQRSKYVQSDTKNIYSQVEKNLKEDRLVLFSGTPCQIAALVGYLSKKPKNLILCEVLCYGVPSPKVYRKYLDNLKKRYNSEIKTINFKDKRYGWDYYTTAVQFENGKEFCKFQGDSYKIFMHKGYSLRPSCIRCNFDTNNSYADISLGDFYNVKQYTNSIINKNGVSCLIIRSEKGEEILQKLNNITLIKVDNNKFSANERRKDKNIDIDTRKDFFNTLNEFGYGKCFDYIGKTGIIKKLKSKILSFRKRYFYKV